MKQFMGKTIPVITDESVGKITRRIMEHPTAGCSAVVQGDLPYCSKVRCVDCILSHTNSYERWKYFVGFRDSVPAEIEQQLNDFELKSGQVYTIDHKNYYLYVNDNLALFLESSNGELEVKYLLSAPHESTEIVEVYNTPTTTGELRMLVSGDENVGAVRSVWKRKEPIMEMSVAEIEQALGHKVKIVGESSCV